MVTRNPALVSSQDGAEYPVLASARTIRRMAPGILIAAGYVDPGNWATDLAAGSRYEYALLAVVVGCGLAAMLFQLMSARLGLAAGMDLAVATRQAWPRAAPFLWMAAEAAIVSTDLAEVLGSAMALHLLFGIPLVLGVALTGFDVAILMALESGRTGLLERAVAGMVLLVGAGLAYEILLARPVPLDVMRGAVPTARLLRDHGMLAVSVGILGATIMPHNLYLHSHLVRSGGREWAMGEEQAELRRVRVDTVRSLAIATLMNAALVVLAARVFYATGHEVADIEEAQRLIAPLLGSVAAPIVFGVALLAAGQSATITATLAGQVVMAGFLQTRWKPWQRRLITRACAIVPALFVVARWGAASGDRLLVDSQIVLSLALPAAIIPLVLFTSDRRKMGAFVNPRWLSLLGWTAAAVVIAADLALFASELGWLDR
jgi:manganese transport protein